MDLSAGFDSPDILVSYYRNIAFSKKNELPQNLMDHYQRGADALFLPIDLRSSILPVFFSNEVYYQLGDMDMARHRAIEGILFSLNKEAYGRSSGWWRLICGEGILRRLENT